MFERKELQEIRTRAEDASQIPQLNSGWKRVYLRLADAASELDAYLARCEIKEESNGLED